jgi:FkbM family methyltransferase
MLPRVNLVRGEGADYLLFSTDDLITNQIVKHGVWEAPLIRTSDLFFQGVQKPQAIDIGANLGSYSIPVGKSLMRYGGSVHSFEPQRIIYYQLCANIFINRLDNVYAHHVAVGSEVGYVNTPCVDYSRFKNIGTFSLIEKHRAKSLHAFVDRYERTKIITLDGFCLDAAATIIKLDVEGYEINVLKGARGFLEHSRFPPILLECWQHSEFDREREELMEAVHHLGYGVTSLFADNFIAQHPSHSSQVEVRKSESGIAISRAK